MEPKAVHFSSASTSARNEGERVKDAAGQKEPMALAFPAPSADSSAQKTAPLTAGTSPAPLAFPEAPAAPVPARQDTGPKALALPEATRPRLPSETASPAPQARPLFGKKIHPLFDLAVEHAKTLEPPLYAQEQLRVNRHIEQLLELNDPAIEHWSDAALQDGSRGAAQAAALNARFMQLNAAAVLEDMTRALAPKPEGSLLERMRYRRMRQNLGEQELLVQRIHRELSALNVEFKDLKTLAMESEIKLQMYYLAIRAVRDVSHAQGHHAKVLAHQTDVLREAVTQANLVTTLAGKTLEASSLLMSQASHLLNVVISFLKLAQSGQASS